MYNYFYIFIFNKISSFFNRDPYKKKAFPKIHLKSRCFSIGKKRFVYSKLIAVHIENYYTNVNLTKGLLIKKDPLKVTLKQNSIYNPSNSMDLHFKYYFFNIIFIYVFLCTIVIFALTIGIFMANNYLVKSPETFLAYNNNKLSCKK